MNIINQMQFRKKAGLKQVFLSSTTVMSKGNKKLIKGMDTAGVPSQPTNDQRESYVTHIY